MKKTISPTVYARTKLVLGIFFALFGVAIIAQGVMKLAAHVAFLSTLPLFAIGVLLIALGYTRYRQYRSVTEAR